MNLDDFFGEYGNNKTNLPCDIYEKSNKYFIVIDLPGYSKDDIKIEVVDDILSISVDEKVVEDNKRTYLKKERTHNKMERSFSLGKVKDALIDAKLEMGVLTVVIPKKEKVQTRRTIEIK